MVSVINENEMNSSTEDNIFFFSKKKHVKEKMITKKEAKAWNEWKNFYLRIYIFYIEC